MHIKEFRLRTAEMAALIKFYRDILELPLAFERDFLEIIAGRSKLVFTTAQGNEHPFYHFAFNIPSNKIEEALEWLSKRVQPIWLKDYESYIADFSGWNAKSVYFPDSAGNIVEFISRFDLNDDSAELFSSALIRNISEAGIVIPENSFDKDIEELQSVYPLPYFSKQPPLPQFRAMGDDEGLLICVPENRPWFPTRDMPAGIFPMELVAESGGREFTLKP